MVAAHVGGTIVFPAPASLIQFSNDIAAPQRDKDEEVTQESLLRIFAPHEDGHDGAVVVDLFDHSTPWICSSGHQLPNGAGKSAVIVEGRGLRHSSAAYTSRLTNALIVVVSEQRGTCSVFHIGVHYMDLSAKKLSAKISSFIRDPTTAETRQSVQAEH